jgi:hypothetical protein
MRCAQAILVIVALIATPLALLARSAGGSMSGCAGMCCPTHGAHAVRVLHEKMLCHQGQAGHFFECTMTPGHHGLDYGLISTIAPTTPSAITSLSVPDVHRTAASEYREMATFGFLSTPLQPPRV